jgi:hypothetical protein
LGLDIGGIYPTSFDFLLGIQGSHNNFCRFFINLFLIRFNFTGDVFVSPITDDKMEKEVTFPQGEWVDWW